MPEQSSERLGRGWFDEARVLGAFLLILVTGALLTVAAKTVGAPDLVYQYLPITTLLVAGVYLVNGVVMDR